MPALIGVLTREGLEHVEPVDGFARARLVVTPATQAKDLEFDSEKAVDYHLRNAYGKLGVRSRRGLRAHFAGGE